MSSDENCPEISSGSQRSSEHNSRMNKQQKMDFTEESEEDDTSGEMSTNSSSSSNDDYVEEDKAPNSGHIMRPAIQLLSLGIVDPLFEMNTEPESNKESLKDIEIELVSEDFNSGNTVVQESDENEQTSGSESSSVQQSMVDENGFLLRSQQTKKDKKDGKQFGNLFKKVKNHVRSQISRTSLQKANEKALKSFSKTMINLNDPNAYPRQPDIKMTKGLFNPDKRFLKGIESVPQTTYVHLFSWDPEKHTEPAFNDSIKRTNFTIDQFLKENPLPNWISHPPPMTLEAEVKNDFLINLNRNQLQLSEALQRELQNVQTNQSILWDKAVEVAEQSVKDFRRIFLYISSKVELVGTEILALSYCNNSDTLAVGSHGGALKLIEFEDISNSKARLSKNLKDITATVVRNELLQGHLKSINHLAWFHSNTECFSKLMSTDVQGVIIGWRIFNSPGHQKFDFLQEQTSSYILGFAWSPKATRICLIYADVDEEGNPLYGIVMGLSNGSRQWNRSLSDASPPQALAWLDEKHFILVQDNVLTLHNCHGQKMKIRYFSEDELGEPDLHDGSLGSLVSLLIKTVYSNTGPYTIALVWQYKMVLLKSLDTQALVLEPQLTITCSSWSPNSVFIAVGGVSRNTAEEPTAQVNLYNCSGKLLTILKVHQPSISCISWDMDSRNLAIGSKNLLYVASVKPVYKFASNGVIHVYAYALDDENYIAFWDINSLNTQKVLGKIVDLKNYGDKFVLLSINEHGIYCVSILNRIGLCIDVLTILTMEPFAVCLTETCLICLSTESILIWRYNSSTTKENKNSIRQIHIDDHPSLIPTLQVEGSEKTEKRTTLDGAVCMDASFDRLCVARFSGKLQIYCLPHGGLLQKIHVAKFNPFQISFNHNGSKICLLDMSGCLRFGYFLRENKLTLDKQNITTGVLNFCWSKDMPDFICVMKRTEMCILHNGNFETFAEYNTLSGYLAGFNNMTITIIKLDEILQNPHQPKLSHAIEVDLKILEFTRQSFQGGDEKEIQSFKANVEMINHPRLWNICGEEELKQMHFDEAEFAFVRSKNYPALQFLKRIKVTPDQLHNAEIYAFLEDYERASEYYVNADRIDLALDLWKKLGNQRQCSKILAKFEGSGDTGKKYSVELAEKHFSSGDTATALKMFKSLKQYDKVLECLLIMDNCEELESFAKVVQVPSLNNANLLGKLAEVYGFLGMTRDAVDIYLEAREPEKALKIAIQNVECSLALEIANQHNIPIVTKSVLSLTKQLLTSGDIMQAVQFLKKCGKTFAAGKLLAIIALRELENPKCYNLLNIKKLFVMAATLLTQKYEPILKSNTRASRTQSRPFVLEDEIDVKFDETIPTEFQPTMEELRWMRQTPWRGAIALQYLILAQKRIYTKCFERAIVVASHLRNFSDILGLERINCLIALTAANGKYKLQCLAALSQLESIDKSYEDIAPEFLNIKTNKKKGQGSDDLISNESICCGIPMPEGTNTCAKCDLGMLICSVSGKLLKKDSHWTCENCGGVSSRTRMKRYGNCPVCHFPLK